MLFDPLNLPDQNVDPPLEEELTDEERQDLREADGDVQYELWRNES